MAYKKWSSHQTWLFAEGSDPSILPRCPEGVPIPVYATRIRQDLDHIQSDIKGTGFEAVTEADKEWWNAYFEQGKINTIFLTSELFSFWNTLISVQAQTTLRSFESWCMYKNYSYFSFGYCSRINRYQ